MLFSLILVIGQLVFTIGGYNSSFGLMLLARAIFGIGGESLSGKGFDETSSDTKYYCE
jgi:hypothetical protein